MQEQNHFCALKKTVAWLSLIASTIEFVARMHCSVLRKKGYSFLHELNSMLITCSDRNMIYKSFHTKKLVVYKTTLLSPNFKYHDLPSRSSFVLIHFAREKKTLFEAIGTFVIFWLLTRKRVVLQQSLVAPHS